MLLCYHSSKDKVHGNSFIKIEGYRILLKKSPTKLEIVFFMLQKMFCDDLP
jgi:hypothetical protein